MIPSLLHRSSATLLVALLWPLSAAAAQPGEAALAEARRAVEAGSFESAIGLLEPASVSLDAEGRLLLAEAYRGAGRAEDALALLEPLAASDGASAKVLVATGQAAAESGDPEKAARLFTRAIQADPSSTAVRELGVLFATMGDHRRGYPLLLDWVRRNPGDGAALLLTALSALDLERPHDALELLGALRADDPRVALLRGRALVLHERGAEAIPLLEPLLADAAPDQAGELRHALADAYLQSEQPTKAIQLIEGNVGDDVQLALKLSAAFEQAGYLSSALSAIKRFVEPLVERLEDLPDELREDAAEMALRYGRLLLASDDAEQASSYLEVATELDELSLDAWRLRAEVHDALGDSAASSTARERVAALEQLDVAANEGEVTVIDDDTGIAIREALVLSRTDPRAALEELHFEAQVAPRDPRPPLAAALVLLNLAQFDDARKAVDLALTLVPAPTTEAARRNELLVGFRVRGLSLKARIAASQNRLDEARSLLSELLQLDPDNEAARLRLERLQALGPE